MHNKNTFSLTLVAKRITFAGITLSAAIIIISIIMAFFVLFGEINIRSVLTMYPPRDYSPYRTYFFNVLFPSMIISSIFGIIIFTVINIILSKRLKILDSAFVEKEIKQNLDSFKLQRISNYREFKDIYFNTYLI